MQLLGSAATNARTSDGRIEKVGHGDTDERLCLPPDHKANIQVDQTQSTVTRSPRVSRVSIAHSRASIRLGRALQDARMHPAKTGNDRVVHTRKRRIKPAQDGQ